VPRPRCRRGRHDARQASLRLDTPSAPQQQTGAKPLNLTVLRAYQKSFELRVTLCYKSVSQGAWDRRTQAVLIMGASAAALSSGRIEWRVVWDEAAIRRAPPPDIEPVNRMTGGITAANRCLGRLKRQPFSRPTFRCPLKPSGLSSTRFPSLAILLRSLPRSRRDRRAVKPQVKQVTLRRSCGVYHW
jgi:hypothetical protein